MTLPTNTHELYEWNAGLIVAYILLAALLDVTYRATAGNAGGTGLRAPDYLFNGATFSASTMIVIGIFDEPVLRLIGDTTIYLILAGLTGFGYTLLALKPKRTPRH